MDRKEGMNVFDREYHEERIHLYREEPDRHEERVPEVYDPTVLIVDLVPDVYAPED